MNLILFNYLHNLSVSPFLANLAILLSKLTFPILGLLLVWSLFFAKRKMFAFSLLFLSGISAWLSAHTLKFLFHTARPFVELGFKPLISENGFSFPSEHSAVFIALAISMLLINKRLGVSMTVLALLIGISRIVLGVHYPIDVLGGFAVGAIISFLYIKLFKKI